MFPRKEATWPTPSFWTSGPPKYEITQTCCFKAPAPQPVGRRDSNLGTGCGKASCPPLSLAVPVWKVGLAVRHPKPGRGPTVAMPQDLAVKSWGGAGIPLSPDTWPDWGHALFSVPSEKAQVQETLPFNFNLGNSFRLPAGPWRLFPRGYKSASGLRAEMAHSQL